MNQQEILKTHKKISESLSNRQLKDSFNTLDLLLHSLQIWSFSETKIELENTYKLMLQYTVEGVQDPERRVIYNKLIASVYALADNAKDALLLRDSNNFEYQQIRMYNSSNPITSEKLYSDIVDSRVNMGLLALVDENIDKKYDLRLHHEQLQIELFNKFWLTQHYTESESSFILRFMKNKEIDNHDRALLVSAVTLNVLRSFDEEKILLLFDFYAESSSLVKQRALVGILLSMYIYNDRLNFYPSIKNRLLLQSDDFNFRKNVKLIIFQFIRSKQTEDIARKLKEEILPEMMKISPMLQKKIDLEDVNNIEDFEEKNPEWQEILEKSGVADKLKEISELQIEGADVFMSTFASLKNFPFFNAISNWFLIFDTQHSALKTLSDSMQQSFLQSLLKSSMMCNSDKYSFCLSLSQISDSQRNMMMSSFRMETEQMEEIKNEIFSETQTDEIVSNQYLQDLYRFYKLYFYKNHFIDIFSLPLDFQNTWLYENIGFEIQDLRELAEYYFSKNHYSDALGIFLHLLEKQKDNVELYQKSGYCYQLQGKTLQALEQYLQAETISTDDKWTIKKIAFCYRLLQNNEKALEYYKRAIQIDETSDIQIELNIGHCLLDLKKYADALNIYFKIELSFSENPKVWRAIAWCSFLCLKLEQAQKYYFKLLETNPNYNDYLNAGHVEWALGNKTKALEYYKKSIDENSGNLADFLDNFEKDIPYLLVAKINEEDIPFMTDRLKYLI